MGSKAVVLTLVGLALGPTTVHADTIVPDLGAASAYGLLAIPQEDDDASARVSSSSDATTSIGVGAPGVYQKSGLGNVIGSVHLETGVTQLLTGSGSPGTITTGVDLSTAIADALAASAAVAALTADISITNLTTSQTINSVGNVTVVEFGDLDLGGLDILTLSGGASDYFILNIDDRFNLSGSSQLVLSGGLTPNHLLINMATAGDPIAISAGSLAGGTFLMPLRDFTLHGAIYNGGIYANDIWISSGGEFTHVPFEPPEPPPPPPTEPVIPEPSSLLLFGTGLLPAATWLRRRTIR